MLPSHARDPDWLAWFLFALIPAVPVALALLAKGEPDNAMRHESADQEQDGPAGEDEPDGMLAAA